MSDIQPPKDHRKDFLTDGTTAGDECVSEVGAQEAGKTFAIFAKEDPLLDEHPV